jgi:signal peptidase II
MERQGQPDPLPGGQNGIGPDRESGRSASPANRGAFALGIGLAIAVLDQYSKYLVRLKFSVGESVPIISGFFDLTHVRNPGAAWGILGGQNAWLTVLSVVLLALMLIFRRSFLSNTWDHRLALGLLIGGIVGNVMDRIRLGGVTDFLDFYWRGHHWPAFNVADAAICTGVGIYILSSLWLKQHPLREGPSEQVVPEKAADGSR